jgi:hypothetical protein
MSRRDEFSEKTKRIIASRVEYRCSHPECETSTCGPCVDNTLSFNIGVAAHITAAAENGPRFDKTLTSEQRKHPDNGIWMCQNHGKEVDDDEIRYTVDLLRRWKKEAEDRQRARMGRPLGSDGKPVTFVEISTAERYGLNGQVGLADGSRMPYATSFVTADERPTFFTSISFVVRFMLEKARDVSNISLCDLQATVYDFQKLPEEYQKYKYAYPQRVYPYILELAVPDPGRPRPCLASVYYPLGSDTPLRVTPLLITEDHPVIIDVRFNAPTSGVYKFALDAVVANGVHKYTFRVLDQISVLFEKFEEIYPDLAEAPPTTP